MCEKPDGGNASNIALPPPGKHGSKRGKVFASALSGCCSCLRLLMCNEEEKIVVRERGIEWREEWRGRKERVGKRWDGKRERERGKGRGKG